MKPGAGARGLRNGLNCVLLSRGRDRDTGNHVIARSIGGACVIARTSDLWVTLIDACDSY
jgi:hypothetical protein